MIIATGFTELTELVLGKVFARLWVSQRACLVAVLDFTSFFHVLLPTDVTKFAKTSLEMFAHRLAITQRQGHIG